MAITGQCQELVSPDTWITPVPCKFKARFVIERPTSAGIERIKVCGVHQKAYERRTKPRKFVLIRCRRCGGRGKEKRYLR